MRIGFIGLGNMGAGIAGNLVRARHELMVWNRNADKAKPLVAAGATLVKSPRAAATDSEVVFTMLADDAALDAVAAGEDGLTGGLKAGGLHISMSTISVTAADRIAHIHNERGQLFLSAPVFGRPEAAAAAKLFVVAAGASTGFQLAQPLLSAVSQRVFYLGDKPSQANLVKLCGNFMILSAIEALGEAMALAEKGGIAKQQLLEIITGTLFDSPVYRIYGGILASDRYTPAGFAAPLGLKDMRLAAQSADALKVPMPLLSVLRDHLLQTIAQRGDDVDWSAIAQSIASNAGLVPAKRSVE
jgi:3-hydroxyisobutyrate dehydrogenase-like beta-hydroxyacid dehydrogenase